MLINTCKALGPIKSILGLSYSTCSNLNLVVYVIIVLAAVIGAALGYWTWKNRGINLKKWTESKYATQRRLWGIFGKKARRPPKIKRIAAGIYELTHFNLDYSSQNMRDEDETIGNWLGKRVVTIYQPRPKTIHILTDELPEGVLPAEKLPAPTEMMRFSVGAKQDGTPIEIDCGGSNPPGVLITGLSGGGKTNLAKVAIEQADRSCAAVGLKMRTLIVDPREDYGEFGNDAEIYHPTQSEEDLDRLIARLADIEAEANELIALRRQYPYQNHVYELLTREEVPHEVKEKIKGPWALIFDEAVSYLGNPKETARNNPEIQKKYYRIIDIVNTILSKYRVLNYMCLVVTQELGVNEDLQIKRTNLPITFSSRVPEGISQHHFGSPIASSPLIQNGKMVYKGPKTPSGVGIVKIALKTPKNGPKDKK